MFISRLCWCRARMAASSDRSNVLLYASTTLSVVTICLFVVACCYFQSVINVQNKQLMLLTDQQDNLKNEVSTLKRKCEEQHSYHCKPWPYGTPFVEGSETVRKYRRLHWKFVEIFKKSKIFSSQVFP